MSGQCHVGGCKEPGLDSHLRCLPGECVGFRSCLGVGMPFQSLVRLPRDGLACRTVRGRSRRRSGSLCPPLPRRLTIMRMHAESNRPSPDERPGEILAGHYGVTWRVPTVSSARR